LDRQKGAISEELRLLPYRVTEEALTNVAKHANATQGTVRGRLADDIIEVSITDNGVGFETENSTPGLGIRMIRDYVDAARGTVGMESAPGNGTTITVTLPIKGLAGSANGMLEDSLLAVA
jgi:signal transduction histidine kinase